MEIMVGYCLLPFGHCYCAVVLKLIHRSSAIHSKFGMPEMIHMLILFFSFLLSWKFNNLCLSFNKDSPAMYQLSCNGRKRSGELTLLFVTKAVTHSGCTPECCRCSCRWGSSQRWPAWCSRHSPARRSGQSGPPQHKSEPVPVGQPRGFSTAMSDWVCWTPTTHLSHSPSQPPVSHQTCKYHPEKKTGDFFFFSQC